jgi:hypothetical protein
MQILLASYSPSMMICHMLKQFRRVIEIMIADGNFLPASFVSSMTNEYAECAKNSRGTLVQ